MKPPAAALERPKHAPPLPPMRWWGRTFIGYDRQRQEERVIQLRLPSWGIGYCVNTDDERWGQRVLMYRGRSGFTMNWHFGSI